MQDLVRFVEEPRRCAYLPEEIASLEVRAITDMSGEEYGDLLARGYRRFGWQIFRPSCPVCRGCRSLRVRAREFTLTASHQRVLRMNGRIRAELRPLFVTREHLELYNQYRRYMHERRGWPLEQATPETYCRDFLSGAAHVGRQWLYFEERRLLGVALMDEVPGAVSLVYCFYSPEWRKGSPGTFSILNQLLYAKARNMDYAYLGYWIENCQSMSYKNRFRPYEVLAAYPADHERPVWE
jgi:arginyl-tRNA--protein-N-Asp/Glu arginylyltransferase